MSRLVLAARRITLPLWALTFLLALSLPVAAQTNLAPMAARGVLQRLLGERTEQIQLESIPAQDGSDVYEFEAHAGIVKVRGSSGVALCRGFYDYLKANHLGMVGWSGARLALPLAWPDAPKTRQVTPFQHRLYFNPVSYGYSTPYWTWKRWEKELDWMALHGVNSPLSLVATEAIDSRVWKRLGLTQPELDAFYTGPAYLPFLRMGCLAKHDGPLPASWHAEQVALQHKILERMRQLGMNPIVNGFAGFVPRGLRRLKPELKLHEMSWGGFEADKRACLLSPSEPLFKEIGRMFIEEWQKEFGPCRHFLVDSFNEMQLPNTGQPKTELLAEFGETMYQTLKSGNPDAVWVIQGWMFGYQRGIWNTNTVKALLSRVPDDKMLIWDEACDYNAHFWKNGMNWELFDAFYGKPWVYSVIPNMGGKTAYTGVLDFYANDIFKVRQAANRGRLVGFGMAMEGIENNEVIYELLSDVAWCQVQVDLDSWLAEYCASRYGGYPEPMQKAWALLRQSCYGWFTDHPSFGWQHGNCSYGSVNRDSRFTQGVQQFLACADTMGGSALYRADALEQAAMVLGLKADDWFVLVRQAYDAGDTQTLQRAAVRGLELLSDADRLLESHPVHRLQRWLDYAAAHGDNEAQKRAYQANARRIVTIWGPPVNDYSCRLWSGLIRDFYRERMARYIDSLATGKTFERATWEAEWVQSTGLSRVEPFADPLAVAVQLVGSACGEPFPEVKERLAEAIGYWSPTSLSNDWHVAEWPLTSDQVRRLKDVRFRYTGGNSRLEIRWLALIADGKEVSRDAHPGYAGAPSSNNTYRLNVAPEVQGSNERLLRAEIRGYTGIDSRGVLQLLSDPPNAP